MLTRKEIHGSPYYPCEKMRQHTHIHNNPIGCKLIIVSTVPKVEFWFPAYTFSLVTAGFAASEGAPLNYDPESRNSFVLLVMLIVLVMLLFTIAFIATVLAT